MDNTKQPLISVIVPVYNVEAYLNRCIDSILGQDYANLELILVNDGSPDRCPTICDEYAQKDTRIKVIHKENGGVSSARNRGMDAMTGEYVAFIDSDDYVDRNYLSELVKYDADVVVSEATEVFGLHCVAEIKENYYSWAGFGEPYRKLYKQKCIDGLRFREDLPVGEDIIFNLSVLQVIENAYYSPYVGYHIVENPNSLTRMNKGRYDIGLDEEYQKKWGAIQAEASQRAGIPQSTQKTHVTNGCSVWVYQKIKNYCYPDCPLPFKERLRRIKRQIDGHRDVILAVKTPDSPRTHLIVKICTILRSPFLAYLILKVLILMKY